MKINPSKLARKLFISNLKNILHIYGLKATVYEYVPTTTIYSEIYNELNVEEGTQKYKETTKVIFRDNMFGTNIFNFLSLDDSIEEEFEIYTLSKLKQNDRVEIVYPDNKTITVRILAPKSDHSFDTFTYKFPCVEV